LFFLKVWDLTPFTNNKKLSLDLHTLVQVNGIYDDTSIPNNNDTGLRAIFTSQNNTIAEMIGSRVHLAKVGMVRINIECYGDDNWREADSKVIILDIVEPTIKKHKSNTPMANNKLYLRSASMFKDSGITMPCDCDCDETSIISVMPDTDPSSFLNKYLITEFLTGTNKKYELKVEDFIVFFNDKSRLDAVIDSNYFNLSEGDLQVWNEETTDFQKKQMIDKIVGFMTIDTIENTDYDPDVDFVPSIKLVRTKKTKKTYSSGNESINFRVLINLKAEKDILVDYTVTQGIIHQKQAVIKKNKRYVDITYVTDSEKLDNSILIEINPSNNYKLNNVNTSKLIYTYKKISDEVGFKSMSDARLLNNNTIKNTHIKSNYQFNFTVDPKSDLSYLIVDYPHLKVDTSTIELFHFDADNNQYQKAEILTGNYRSIKRIGTTKINRVAIKLLSGKDNTSWRLIIGGLLNRLDNIEIVSVGLRNSKYENFIKKNMYSKDEIKELKETYPEMFWRKGLLEDGIQFEIRLKRDSINSEPQVKKLVTINVLDDVVKAQHNDIDQTNTNEISLLQSASSKIVTGMKVYYGNKTQGNSNSWQQLINNDSPITVKSFNKNTVYLSDNYTDIIPADVDIKFENNSIVAKKSRNDLLYKSSIHTAERNWLKGTQYEEDFFMQPTDNARDNLFYNFYNENKKKIFAKSTKYNFYK
jgi:hypothetical protein